MDIIIWLATHSNVEWKISLDVIRMINKHVWPVLTNIIGCVGTADIVTIIIIITKPRSGSGQD